MKKSVWIHAGLVVVMLAVAMVYFAPVLSGKAVMQGDIQKFEAMAKETKDYHAKTGEYARWNSAMFSGMPVYQIGGNAPMKSIFTPLRQLTNLEIVGASRDIGVLFLYLLGFYVALVALGCSPLLALLGALAFGLGSYNIIIVEAGHISKAWALAMMAPILAGMILCLRRPKEGDKKWGDWLWGGLLFTLALGLQLNFNHIQITYYTIIGALLLGLTHFIYAAAEKRLPRFMGGVGILLLGCALAFAGNARALMVSQQYAKYTMRGGNAITVTPEDLYHDGEPASISGKKSGLDIDYAFSWSYGIGETYTLLVPGAMGGGSGEPVSTESASYKAFHQQQMPLYWGNQPFTSGPVYFGAIVIFLFFVGLMLVRGPERWWLLAATVVAILMSWGRNFMGLNEWLFNTLPLYNKFRTPSMSLVLANVCMVLMGMLGLKELFSADVEQKRKNLALYVGGGVTAAMLLIGLLLSGSFSYSGASDAQMAGQYGNQWQQIQDIFIQDRKALFTADSWRSMLFVALAFAALWLYNNKMSGKKSAPAILAAVLALLVVIDLWGVDRRYLNEKNFVSEQQIKLKPDQWDYTIDEMAARFGDQDYRVLNMATNTFNDSKPAAFHHQIGGYSAVKMRRYQDLIDFYMTRELNMNVLNMLNTRYFIVPDQQGSSTVQRNPAALGNAWFVDSCQLVDDANAEILALNDFNPANKAIIDKRFASYVEGKNLSRDTTSAIEMTHLKPYNPDYLVYSTYTDKEQLAIFSEVYYAPDWKAYIDGQPAEYFRANYILRAMVIPAGQHKVEFINEAPMLKIWDIVSIAFSVVLALIIVGVIFLKYKKEKLQKSAVKA